MQSWLRLLPLVWVSTSLTSALWPTQPCRPTWRRITRKSDALGGTAHPQKRWCFTASMTCINDDVLSRKMETIQIISSGNTKGWTPSLRTVKQVPVAERHCSPILVTTVTTVATVIIAWIPPGSLMAPIWQSCCSRAFIKPANRSDKRM